uniref:Bucky ball n=1 Tax=Denticeps clupeoides TaxID=299321 RepID=A0AAY3ZXZ7_9TELE
MEGSGQPQQRPVNHTRPFFYVQPPSQPYYMYQWHANPYHHYGFHGSGLPLPRPYVSPYSYMQYPGYIVPHAPVHPLDYRRVFDPHLGPMAAYDVTLRQQHQHGTARKETACSGAQTDPSEALNKLIECLDKLRSSDVPSAERELDSGNASQSSGIFSPGEERKRAEPEDGSRGGEGQVCQGSPEAIFCDSGLAAYDGSLEKLGQTTEWLVDSDGEPPLDTSSLHEDEDELDLHQVCSTEGQIFRSEPQPVRNLEDDRTDSKALQDREEHLKQGSVAPSHPPSSQDGTSVMSQEASEQSGAASTSGDARHNEQSRVARLPCEKVLSAGVLQKGSPRRSPSVPPLLPLGQTYYSYCPPQLAHERISVLSPSLDELSSRDEMFSTDLEDLDLFPGHVYTEERLPEASSADSREALALQEEVCTVCHKRFTCAGCSLSVTKKAQRPKVHATGLYGYDDAGDSDEEVVEEKSREEHQSARGSMCDTPHRPGVKKPLMSRTSTGPPVRQQVQPKLKRLRARDGLGDLGQPEEQEVECPRHCCSEDHGKSHAQHRVGKGTFLDSSRFFLWSWVNVMALHLLLVHSRQGMERGHGLLTPGGPSSSPERPTITPEDRYSNVTFFFLSNPV